MNHFLPVLLILFSVLITSCSKLQLAYEFAPGIIVGRMDDYFDLNSKQKSALKTTLKSELDRIIVEQLPKYIELEKEWSVYLLKKDLSQLELKTHMTATRAWMLGVFASMEPALLPHALTLTPQQLEYFKKELTKELEKLEERISSPEGQKKELRRRFSFALDWNFKSLSNEDEKRFELFLEQHHYPFQLEAINRRNSMNAFVDAAKDPVVFKAHLEKIFRAPMSMRGKDYSERMDAFIETYMVLQFRIMTQADDKDRKLRVEYIADRITQLTELREKVLKSRAKN